MFIILFLGNYKKYFVTNYKRSTMAVLPLMNKNCDPRLDNIASGLTSEISGPISQVSTWTLFRTLA